ncbi:AmmeMemoRadiSam system protein B [Sphaceloma murrayae]|uniref:AmmeMemoRadiSam system protein B n=1 Tax=Sphaceloma murrayae TaxID=2082308 RepID=A0A2K1R3E8_9PEZI|nr:AmmeMemoRadiSam system protein B [Sphaceloma murrayae]
MSVRQASHAGSWYTSSGHQLSSQLEGWLNDVKKPVKGIGSASATSVKHDTLPVPGARIIIAPHAGYAYSGAAAAWAYKSWDVSNVQVAPLVSSEEHLTAYATPMGNLTVDRATTEELHKTGQFSYMTKDVDEDEHSLEMHLPYIYKMLTFGAESNFPPLTPIMIGNTPAATERALGKILAPFLSDPSNAFVVSSDFAHWGTRFRYTYYVSSSGEARHLRGGEKEPKDPAIHESIKDVDFECIDACETGDHQAWLDVLAETGNTVCGRHPIGVVMAGIQEVLANRQSEVGDGKFRFVRYERSSLVKKVADSSVSYASAYAVL